MSLLCPLSLICLSLCVLWSRATPVTSLTWTGLRIITTSCPTLGTMRSSTVRASSPFYSPHFTLPLTLLLCPPQAFTLSPHPFTPPPPFYAAPSPFYSALLTLLPCPLTLLLTHSLFLNQTHICSNKSTQWVTLWFMLC